MFDSEHDRDWIGAGANPALGAAANTRKDYIRNQ